MMETDDLIGLGIIALRLLIQSLRVLGTFKQL